VEDKDGTDPDDDDENHNVGGGGDNSDNNGGSDTDGDGGDNGGNNNNNGDEGDTGGDGGNGNNSGDDGNNGEGDNTGGNGGNSNTDGSGGNGNTGGNNTDGGATGENNSNGGTTGGSTGGNNTGGNSVAGIDAGAGNTAVGNGTGSTISRTTAAENGASSAASYEAEGFSEKEARMLEAQTGNLVTDLFKGNVPEGSFSTTAGASLLSLILAVFAAFGFIIMAAVTIIRNASRRRGSTVFITAITAAIGAATFIVWLVLDSLEKPTTWVNSYTPIIAVLFILFIAAVRTHKGIALRLAGNRRARV
jgi:hypothetical protein